MRSERDVVWYVVNVGFIVIIMIDRFFFFGVGDMVEDIVVYLVFGNILLLFVE